MSALPIFWKSMLTLILSSLLASLYQWEYKAAKVWCVVVLVFKVCECVGVLGCVRKCVWSLSLSSSGCCWFFI